MTRGTEEPSVGTATSSFTTSAERSLSACLSRTPIQREPSGVTRPSAYLSRLPSTSGEIESVFGTAFDDVIRGNAFDNELYGGAGDDVLDGKSGDDLVESCRKLINGANEHGGEDNITVILVRVEDISADELRATIPDGVE